MTELNSDESVDVIFRLAGVSKSYGTIQALNDVSIELSRGSLTGLVGPNGSGKTTLLRLLAGVERPSGGSVFYEGLNLGAEDVGIGIGAHLDKFDLWHTRQVQGSLRYLARLLGQSEEDVQAVIALHGLESLSRRKLGKLSLGNRQRVLVAAATLAGTRCVLLDEPMNGLDPAMRTKLREILHFLVAEGRTVVLSTHDLQEIETICPQLLLLNDGTVRYHGQTSDFGKDQHSAIIRVDQEFESNLRALLARAGIPFRLSDGQVVVRHELASSARKIISPHDLGQVTFEVVEASLEDTFHAKQ